MSSPGGPYTNKELTIKTGPDFERLSWQGNGWDFCWCMHFQRPQTLPKNRWQHTRADRGLRNRFSRSSCGRSREWALQPTRSVEHFGGGEWQADDWGSQERKGLRSAPALYWKFAQGFKYRNGILRLVESARVDSSQVIISVLRKPGEKPFRLLCQL
jgi:hypothetical protein